MIHSPAHSPDRPWRGVLVATALPLRDDLSVDHDLCRALRLAGGERL